MAKYRHRIFEMYEFRAEAVRALTPKTANTIVEATPPESWTFRHLAVTRKGSVTFVTFDGAQAFDAENVTELAEDFLQLADQLVLNSKVLLDFEGVDAFCPASIEALALFDKKLRIKGSRMALCGLEPATRESFFADR